MSVSANSIAIAGAGIGGLATAFALSRRGVASNIYERRAAFSEEGAGIQLGPNATGVLSQLGLLDDVREIAASPDALSIHDARTGRVLSRFPLGTAMAQRHGFPYLTVHRQDLHTILRAAVERDAHIKLQTNFEITSFENRSDDVEISIAGKAPVSALALIAADGLWSRLRGQVTSCGTPKPTGKVAYRTVLPSKALPSTLSANDVHIWLSTGSHAVHYPVRGGNEIAVVVIVEGEAGSESWSNDAQNGWPGQTLSAKYAPALQDLISSADSWRMWPLMTLPPLSAWNNGRVALLGDAAHPILPFFAQGGAMALEDAVTIATCLAAYQDAPLALATYSRMRRARVERVAKASHSNGRNYHLEGPMAAARNAVLATVPGNLMMRRYDWLYGWKG